MRGILAAGLAAVAIFSLAARSQAQVNTTEGAHVAEHGLVNDVNKHQALEEKLIADGTQAGQITAAQADNFRQRMNAIQAQKISAMSADAGHLTNTQYHNLRGKQDALEAAIQQASKKAAPSPQPSASPAAGH